MLDTFIFFIMAVLLAAIILIVVNLGSLLGKIEITLK
jgi:hypothetical protein